MGALIWIVFLVVAGHSKADTIVRQTRLGMVKGIIVEAYGRLVEVYKGIPFAEPPLGNLRFKEPLPRSPWEGTYDTTTRTRVCHQVLRTNFFNNAENFTEDCLHLGIWTPSEAANSPVLVWIHGGGFAYGSGFREASDGLVLAATRGLVLVAISYRLGILGFLNANSPHAPGNQGLLDQHLALQWVQDNIRFFGGDPESVTIIGHSAGAMSVHAHILSPMSRGLFKRAVMLSGSHNNIDFMESVHESTIKGNDVAKLLGCSKYDRDLVSHPDEVLECLRSKTADELALAVTEVTAPKPFSFFPTFHDQFLPRVPAVAMDRGFFQDIDVLVGVTSDECAVLVIFPPGSVLFRESMDGIDENTLERALLEKVSAWTRFDIQVITEEYLSKVPAGNKLALAKAYLNSVSDRLFNCPVQFFAEKHAARGNAVYSFIHSHRSKKDGFPSWMGVPHHEMTPYLFSQPWKVKEDFTEEDRTVSDNFVTMIESFVRNGKPLLPNGHAWPKFTKETPISIVFDYNNFTSVRGYRSDECEIWRKVL
ncbi:unnamed protein product [Ixodes pacificus]